MPAYIYKITRISDIAANMSRMCFVYVCVCVTVCVLKQLDLMHAAFFSVTRCRYVGNLLNVTILM